MKPSIAGLTVVVLWALTSVGAGADCLPADAGNVMKAPTRSPIRAALQTVPRPITVGEPFVAEVSVCGARDGRIDRLVVDATMPAHRHGMNYKPEITDLGQGRYQAKGLLFHMPGRWEFVVTVLLDGVPTRLTLDVDVK